MILDGDTLQVRYAAMARQKLGITTGGGAGSVNFSAGVASANLGSVTFADANNVSFGLAGGIITAIANTVGGGAITNIKFSAGTYSTYRSDITFGNSNGVSFGQDTNGFITATVATNYQSQGAYLTTAQPPGAYLTTAQPPGAYLTTAALSQDSSKYAGTAGSISGGSMTLNTSGLTIDLPAYLTTAQPPGAYLTTAALSQDSSKYAGTGFTTATTAGTDIVGTLNTNGLSMGVPAYLTTAATGGGAGTGFTTASTAGTDVVGTLDTNGLSMGIPAYLTTAQPPGAYLTTAQPPGAYLTTAALSQDSSKYAGTSTGMAGGSVTLDTAGISISLPAYLTTAALSEDSSNYAGTNGTMTGGSLTINTSGLSISLPAYLTTFAYPRLDQVLDPTADKVFSMGSNQLQLSWATGGSFSTNATRQGFFELDLAGNLTQEADLIHAHQHGGAPTLLDILHIEGDGANVTGARLQMSASIAAELNMPIKFTTRDAGYSIGSVPMILGTGMSNVVSNLNANYLQGSQASQFQSAGAYLTTAQPVGNYAGTGTSVVTTAGTDLTMALNTGGLTVAYPKWITTYVNDLTSDRAGTGFTSTSTAGAVITAALGTNGLSMAVPAYLTTAAATNVTSDRAGTNTSVVTTGGTDLSFAVNTSGVTIAYPKWLTTAPGITNINVSAGTTSSNISAVTFADSNGISFGLGTGARAGVITATAATNYQTIPPVTLSYWANMPSFTNTSAHALESNSFYVFPLTIGNYVSASYLRILGSISFVSTTIATSAVNNVTGASTAFNETVQWNALLYTVGTGTASRILANVFSTSAGLTWAVSVSQQSTSNASRCSITQAITFPNEGANTDNVTTQYSVSATNSPISTTQWSTLSAYRFLDIPCATLISPGNYWLALNRFSGTVGGKNIDIKASSFGIQQVVNGFSNIASTASGTAMQHLYGAGTWTTNVAATSASMGFTNITVDLNSRWIPYVNFIRQA